MIAPLPMSKLNPLANAMLFDWVRLKAHSQLTGWTTYVCTGSVPLQYADV